MRIRKTALRSLVVALLLTGATVAGCTKGQSTQRITTMKTDVDELSRFIAFPFPPKAAWWRTADRGDSGALGPSDWELMAVLQFAPEDIESIIGKSGLQKSDPPEKIIASSPGMSELLKNHGPLEDRLYGAELFARSPLIDGFVVRIKGTDKLFIYLATH